MDARQILQPVEDVWHHHYNALEEALDETIRELQNLLRLDEYHRHGHEEPQLKETLGPMGSASLNLASLSEVLGKSAAARCLPPERVDRVNRLLGELGEIKQSCAAAPAAFPAADIDEDEARIHALAEEHLNAMARIFSHLRMAQLEVRSKYDPATHDPFFAAFNWRQLSPAELRLCPPFLVIAHLGAKGGPVLRKVMALLESRKPLKIAVLRACLRKEYAPTADPAVPATMAVEMLPLAMRGVYFLQTSIAVPDFAKRLFEALTSPRPTLISLLARREDEGEDAFRARTERALRSRAFPAVVYDPDKARGFVSCFDLSGNPASEETYTFADFAIADESYAAEFTDPPAGLSQENLVLVPEYLELTRHQRIGKLPCVYLQGHDGAPAPKVVSTAVVTQASDQLHLWRTLMELAGIDNPYVTSTRDHLTAEFGERQQALLDKVQEDVRRSQAEREQFAVAAAVRKLVANLTGVDAAEIDLQELMGRGE